MITTSVSAVERKRERRDKEIYKERQGGDSRWWAYEREREGERGDKQRDGIEK